MQDQTKEEKALLSINNSKLDFSKNDEEHLKLIDGNPMQKEGESKFDNLIFQNSLTLIFIGLLIGLVTLIPLIIIYIFKFKIQGIKFLEIMLPVVATIFSISLICFLTKVQLIKNKICYYTSCKLLVIIGFTFRRQIL